MQKKKEFIDWGKLKTEEMSGKYLIDVKNKYEVLLNESIQQPTHIALDSFF